MNSSLITLLFAAGLINVSLATYCFVCNSEVNSQCGDVFDDTANDGLKINCQGWGQIEDGGCSKVKTLKGEKERDGYNVVRTCGQVYDNKYCDWTDEKQGPWSCSCEGDNCNSSTHFSLATSLLLFTVLAYIMM